MAPLVGAAFDPPAERADGQEDATRGEQQPGRHRRGGHHEDDVGEDAYNEELSTKRARAVEQAVASARPDLDTTARGRGSADPVAPNRKGGEDNPEGRAKNRRVEITHD